MVSVSIKQLKSRPISSRIGAKQCTNVLANTEKITSSSLGKLRVEILSERFTLDEVDNQIIDLLISRLRLPWQIRLRRNYSFAVRGKLRLMRLRFIIPCIVLWRGSWVWTVIWMSLSIRPSILWICGILWLPQMTSWIMNSISSIHDICMVHQIRTCSDGRPSSMVLLDRISVHLLAHWSCLVHIRYSSRQIGLIW